MELLRTKRDRYNLINEVRVLASIRDVNVVSFKEAFIDPEINSLW